MDLSSMLPLLMMNKGGKNNDDMMNIINAMNAMRNNDTKNTASTASTSSTGSANKESDYIKDNCKEPKFWNSPARECGSESSTERQAPFEAAGTNSFNAAGAGTNLGTDGIGSNNAGNGLGNLAPLLAMMNNGSGSSDSPMGNLAPLLAMMNNGGGANQNPLMSMLPFLMNNGNKSAAKTASVGNPFDPIKHFCPLPIRMKLNYYLAK